MICAVILREIRRGNSSEIIPSKSTYILRLNIKYYSDNEKFI